ncbi:MAG: hypothetical protein C0599_18395 [Salinivirgaceae bacterium]|nr:MAG: hypothetical protein C0599_18395 [Salinivirgaceae bacterium]
MIKSSNIKWTILTLVLLLLFYSPLLAQNDSLLLQINTDHIQLKKSGMTVLGTWALSNIAVSGFMMTRTRGVNYHFHEMNVFWNVVNLGIAGGAYYAAVNGQYADANVLTTLQTQEKFGKILLFNAGLDVAYVMSGVYLRERSKNTIKHQHRLKGYGNSIILQGSFLFAFDLILYGINDSAIQEWMSNNDLYASIYPGGISISYFFN